MKKKIAIMTFILTLLCAVSAFAAATFSDAWVQGMDGVWRAYDRNGVLQKNVWFCDDAPGGPQAADNWYLLDANGNMVSAGIVRDGTGNYYSLETNHNGYYGMIRHVSGTYDGINIIFSQNHDGTFGAIQNPDARDALIAKYGLVDVSHISNANCVYSSKLLGTSNPGSGSSSSSGYAIRYYVNGSLYSTKTNSTSSMKIISYSNNLLYWEDRNTGEIYYPGDYAYFESKRTLVLDAVLESKKQTYTLTYYSNNEYYDEQTSSNGKFRVLDEPWTTALGVEFVAWQDSRGNRWEPGETYTAYTKDDRLKAVWKSVSYGW